MKLVIPFSLREIVSHTFVALVKPYLVSILPIGTVLSTDSSAPAHAVTGPVLQARSTLSLTVSQTIPYPFAALKTSKSLPTTQYSLRLLSPGPFGNSPLFLLSSPNDRTTLSVEGSALWLFDLKGWDAQIDELVAECKYSEALELLDSLEDGSVPNKVCPCHPSIYGINRLL
jgi:Vam6/Vps39-like protein vacuolar protein sorting-associated protein 39